MEALAAAETAPFWTMPHNAKPKALVEVPQPESFCDAAQAKVRTSKDLSACSGDLGPEIEVLQLEFMTPANCSPSRDVEEPCDRIA